MDFIPEQTKDTVRVPYYEEAKAADGWQGHTTQKSIKALQSEITQVVSRLGGTIIDFQKGTFPSAEGNRDGFRIDYTVTTPTGKRMPGRIDIAALPIDPALGWRADKEKHRESSLRMALYMLRTALEGTWFMQMLSPGYSALVPFMLGPGQKTISQLWTDGPMAKLLPAGEDGDFIEGESREIK